MEQVLVATTLEVKDSTLVLVVLEQQVEEKGPILVPMDSTLVVVQE